MSDEKKYTVRDVAYLRRDAYAQGYRDGSSNWTHEGVARSVEKAAKFYPLPKVTRPRVVVDPLEWRIRWSVDEDGAISGESNDCGHWYGITLGHSAFLPIASRIAVWADLIAQPTEEVDA